MQDLRSAQTVIEKERANITDLSAEREPSTQRTTDLARLSELTAQHRQLSLTLKGYEKLAVIAEQKNIKIINLNPESYVDCFDFDPEISANFYIGDH